jgi:hypothetical protein
MLLLNHNLVKITWVAKSNFNKFNTKLFSTPNELGHSFYDMTTWNLEKLDHVIIQTQTLY